METEGVSQAEPLRVILADDHRILRDGVVRVLEEDDIQVVAAVEDGNGLLAALIEHPCDAVLLDLSLPDYAGFELIALLRQRHPHVPVLVLSMYPEHQYAPGALRAGARGYLNKGCSGADLCGALRRVALAPHLDADTAPNANDPTPRGHVVPSEGTGAVLPHQRLSEREWQVFLLLAGGKTPSEVGYALGLGSSTVSTYVVRIRKKLGIGSIGEIVRYAILHNLVG